MRESTIRRPGIRSSLQKSTDQMCELSKKGADYYQLTVIKCGITLSLADNKPV